MNGINNLILNIILDKIAVEKYNNYIRNRIIHNVHQEEKS